MNFFEASLVEGERSTQDVAPKRVLSNSRELLMWLCHVIITGGAKKRICIACIF